MLAKEHRLIMAGDKIQVMWSGCVIAVLPREVIGWPVSDRFAENIIESAANGDGWTYGEAALDHFLPG